MSAQQALFAKNLKSLAAIMGGKVDMPSKVNGDEISEIVEGLISEQKAILMAEVKTGLSKIINDKVKLEKEIKEFEEELSKKKEEKYKEFNGAVSNLYKQIENVKNIEKEYYNALVTVSEVNVESATEEISEVVNEVKEELQSEETKIEEPTTTE